MTGVSSIRLKHLEGMSIQQIMRYVESFGYDTSALSNDDIYALAEEIMDGHWDGEVNLDGDDGIGPLSFEDYRDVVYYKDDPDASY